MNKIQLGQLLHANNLNMDEYLKNHLDNDSFEVNGTVLNYYRHDVERFIRKRKGEDAVLEID